MRTITLEEHFVSPAFLAGPGKDFAEQLRNRGRGGVRIHEQLQDIGEKRIGEMDAAGIDMQVLSLSLKPRINYRSLSNRTISSQRR
jgi:hypothetical protein